MKWQEFIKDTVLPEDAELLLTYNSPDESALYYGIAPNNRLKQLQVAYLDPTGSRGTGEFELREFRIFTHYCILKLPL